jgi:hypothetical protein
LISQRGAFRVVASGTSLAMLNWSGLCSLLMPLIGMLSGFGSAHDMKAGILMIILFSIGGLLIGFGMSLLSFKFERWFHRKGKSGFANFISPTVCLLIAGSAPGLLALIIFRHK